MFDQIAWTNEILNKWTVMVNDSSRGQIYIQRFLIKHGGHKGVTFVTRLRFAFQWILSTFEFWFRIGIGCKYYSSVWSSSCYGFQTRKGAHLEAMSERKVTRLFPRRVWCYSVHRLLLVLYFIRNLEGSCVGPHLCLVLPQIWIWSWTRLGFFSVCCAFLWIWFWERCGRIVKK